MRTPRGAPSRIVIHGMGAISALGRGLGVIAPALERGEDGIRSVERFDMTPFSPVHLGGMVVVSKASAEAWSIDAAREAWADAGLPDLADGGLGTLDPTRVAVVVGTTDGEKGDIARLGRTLADALGARGPVWTISTACSSSANALGLGKDLILEGDADIVIAGGAEALSKEMFAGFVSLGVLSAEKCAPFGETTGTTLGEGAGFVVLEREGARDRRARAFFVGYGLSSDAWHETSPDPRGEGISRAMLGAMGDASITAADVGYVNAHATGTAANDDSEWRGIERALGPRALSIPVNGSKSFFAHAQGAAGILETLATLVSMEAGLVPPSLRIGAGRLRGPRDLVLQGTSRARTVEVALSNSAAFGGANAVVAVSCRRPPEPPRLGTRRVRIEGAARIGTAAGAPRDEAAIAQAAGPVDLRSTDPSGRLMVAAAARALADAGVRVKGTLRDRAGIFGAATRLSPQSGKELLDSIEKHGPERASASAFARVVLHAPTGTASRLLGLRGPTTTLACEPAGLFALAYAGRWLARRTDADVLVVGGVDERGIRTDDPTRDGEEGAASLVLSALPSARAGAASERAVEIAGVATAGAGGTAAAIASARRAAGLDDSVVLAPFALPEADLAPTYRSLSVVIDAIDAIRRGEHGAVVVGSARGGTVCVVLLAAEPGA